MFVNDALVSSHASTKEAQAKITFHYLIIKKSHIWILYFKLKAFREKFKSSNSSIGTTHQRQIVEENTRKLFKALFLMTGASAAFWFQALLSFSFLTFAPEISPQFVKYVFTIIHDHLCNSASIHWFTVKNANVQTKS